MEREAERLGLRWYYHEYQAEMDRGTVNMAAVKSGNEIKFGFPYANSQRGTLMLRIHPKYGKDVILSLEHGQFLTGVDGGEVTVRFDSGKEQVFRVNGMADYKTNAIFIRDYERFLNAMRTAKRVQIEAFFYQEATRVFEFNVTGLKC